MVSSNDQRDPVAYVISLTPFDRSGRLDEAAARAHWQRMAEAGLGIYVGGGGSGEGFALDARESSRLLELAVEERGGAVRAMGAEPRTAAEMRAFVDRAARAGVEACQIYSLDPGHGHRPTMAEVERYFDEVLAACPVPAVISTHQSVGYRIPVPLLAALVQRHPHVIGVNCSHADLSYLGHLVDALGAGVEVCVGGPLQALSAWGLGAHGFLSSEANLAPRLVTGLVRAVEAGDLALAFERFGVLARLHELLYGNGGIRMTKAVLARLGLPGGGVPRLPQLAPEAVVVDEVLASLRELGLDELEGWNSHEW